MSRKVSGKVSGSPPLEIPQFSHQPPPHIDPENSGGQVEEKIATAEETPPVPPSSSDGAVSSAPSEEPAVLQEVPHEKEIIAEAPAQPVSPVAPVSPAPPDPTNTRIAPTNPTGESPSLILELETGADSVSLKSITEIADGAVLPDGSQIHVVQGGDTLWHIAEKYTGNPFNYPSLATASGIEDADLIFPGEQIVIYITRADELKPE